MIGVFVTFIRVVYGTDDLHVCAHVGLASSTRPYG